MGKKYFDLYDKICHPLNLWAAYQATQRFSLSLFVPSCLCGKKENNPPTKKTESFFLFAPSW
jgi:hypothetical protein